ncbi:amino acid ABC transporter substrate-binding protein [Curvibacter delicatus]|jgi:ABC-type branched-subunit amino acid transport system substrate-binding protein|uniref:amino acid ABC transporter substrate-binding protein n=1 Tax=Curvibacter delicatus TaxID=80879 RepID=UPI000831A0BB|nr:amino acid ABC transporter substrate-binding protein [Curvibacter delicatus]
MKKLSHLIAAGAAALTTGLAALPAQAAQGSCSEPIVFGTTISETGPFSTLADRWRKMTEVFAEEVNKAGGIAVKACNKKLPLKFVVYDDQSVPATAVALFEKMASVDKVDFFVGPDWSSLGGPVPPVAEKHKIPMVMANVATPSVYDRGLKYVWGTPFPVVPNWSARYFDMLSKVSPKPQTIFFITHDNPVMKGITATWSKKAEGQGLKVLGNETFSSELKDFTALIAKVRAAKADVIYISSYDNASVPLVQQMRQLKVRAMDVHHTMLTGALSRQVGKDIDGMTGELSWYPGVKGAYSDLVETVMKRSDVSMFDYIWTLGRLTSYLAMIQGIEKAGVVDREKVKEALFKATIKSPAGDVTFDERGFPDTSAFTVQMSGGKVNVVWPPEVSTAKLVWPSPSWK